MAYTKKGEQHNIQGGWWEIGIFTLDAASIAAASQGVETVTIEGIDVGDSSFINAQAPTNRIAIVGSKVTAQDTLTVYINNLYDATTAVNAAELTFDVMIFHKSRNV